MKTKIGTLFIVVMVLASVGIAFASANGFTIPWWSVDGGGGTSQGGEYAVSGSIGQPDAGPLMRGGAYTLVGGFWGGALTPPGPNQVYLPLVVR
jgi:hypothetical protein